MRLLLAEDEKSLSRAVCAILEHSGYEVDAVYDGNAALERVMSGSYDGAILDIMMPEKDGVEVVQALRETGSRLPVLLLTAKSELDDKVLGLDAGANDYMTKPFAVPELLARLRVLLRDREEWKRTVLSAGNIRLDRSTQELSSPTGDFRLSGRELQMMELFLCSPGRRLSAGRLLERLWEGEETEVDIVKLYVSYLQTKLDALHADIRLAGNMEEGYVLESMDPRPARPDSGELFLRSAAGEGRR